MYEDEHSLPSAPPGRLPRPSSVRGSAGELQQAKGLAPPSMTRRSPRGRWYRRALRRGADGAVAGKSIRPKSGRGVVNAPGTVHPGWNQRHVHAANPVGHVARGSETDVLPNMADKPPGLGTQRYPGARGLGGMGL
jgi:hypothetical protein